MGAPPAARPPADQPPPASCAPTSSTLRSPAAQAGAPRTRARPTRGGQDIRIAGPRGSAPAGQPETERWDGSATDGCPLGRQAAKDWEPSIFAWVRSLKIAAAGRRNDGVRLAGRVAPPFAAVFDPGALQHRILARAPAHRVAPATAAADGVAFHRQVDRDTGIFFSMLADELAGRGSRRRGTRVRDRVCMRHASRMADYSGLERGRVGRARHPRGDDGAWSPRRCRPARRRRRRHATQLPCGWRHLPRVGGAWCWDAPPRGTNR